MCQVIDASNRDFVLFFVKKRKKVIRSLITSRPTVMMMMMMMVINAYKRLRWGVCSQEKQVVKTSRGKHALAHSSGGVDHDMAGGRRAAGSKLSHLSPVWSFVQS